MTDDVEARIRDNTKQITNLSVEMLMLQADLASAGRVSGSSEITDLTTPDTNLLLGVDRQIKTGRESYRGQIVLLLGDLTQLANFQIALMNNNGAVLPPDMSGMILESHAPENTAQFNIGGVAVGAETSGWFFLLKNSTATDMVVLDYSYNHVAGNSLVTFDYRTLLNPQGAPRYMYRGSGYMLARNVADPTHGIRFYTSANQFTMGKVLACRHITS